MMQIKKELSDGRLKSSRVKLKQYLVNYITKGAVNQCIVEYAVEF